MSVYKMSWKSAQCVISKHKYIHDWERSCVAGDQYLAGYQQAIADLAEEFPELQEELKSFGEQEVEVWMDRHQLGPYSVQPKHLDVWIIDEDHPPRVELDDSNDNVV